MNTSLTDKEFDISTGIQGNCVQGRVALKSSVLDTE